MAPGVFSHLNVGVSVVPGPPAVIGAPLAFTEFILTKTGGGGDPDILEVGDLFTVTADGSLLGITYVYQGQDGSGGVIGQGSSPSENIWAYITDSPQTFNDPWPAIDPIDVIICFATGTLIATPHGEKVVESLEIGDLVLTTDGRSVPVHWVGRQTRRKLLTRERSYAPVRVRANALALGVPHTDLILTGDHALIVDDLAINASALVNGTTITFEPTALLPDKTTYWHIETEGHEEILANGAPAESFVDYIGRRSFDNYQEYLDLYGCERIIPEMQRPRVSSRRQLPAATAARFGIASFGDDVDAEYAALIQDLLPA